MIFQGGMFWLISLYFLCIYCRLLLCSYHVVQSFSHGWLFVTPCTAAHQVSLSLIVSWSLLKLTSVESMMPPLRFILCHPLLLLPSIFLSSRVFSNGWALHIRWPKYWSFNLSISPPNEFSELIPCRINLFDLLAVQGTLKSLLRHHSLKESVFQHSAFFMVQLSHLYMTTEKKHSFDFMKLGGKLMSLLFNMLPRPVMAFLPKSKHF